MRFMKSMRNRVYAHWKTMRKGTAGYRSWYHWYHWSSKWYSRYRSAWRSSKKSSSSKRRRRVWRYKVFPRMLQPPLPRSARDSALSEARAGGARICAMNGSSLCRPAASATGWDVVCFEVFSRARVCVRRTHTCAWVNTHRHRAPCCLSRAGDVPRNASRAPPPPPHTGDVA